MDNLEKIETIEAYNKSAKELARKFDNIGVRKEDIKRAFSYFKNKNLNVIELGCGNGRDAKEILKYTKKYLGIDISEELIKIAKQNNPEEKFETADLENYNFQPNIDIIFSFASLIHSNKEKIKIVFEKTAKALNKEGIFYISVKHDDYGKKTLVSEFGTRTYFFIRLN